MNWEDFTSFLLGGRPRGRLEVVVRLGEQIKGRKSYGVAVLALEAARGAFFGAMDKFRS